MLRDVMRFNRGAEVAVAPGQTIGDLTRELGLGEGFRRLYIRPFCGAIWSLPDAEVDTFPAAMLVSFFRNHGLLAMSGQHSWWTVTGGSRSYVDRLGRHLARGGVRLRPGCAVRRVERSEAGVLVTADGAEPETFDAVVLACHADQALALLAEPSRLEQRLLGAIRFRANRAVLHADPAQMPRRKAGWSSWNARAGETGVSVTYWMNRLQNLPEDDPLFVTLNPDGPIADHLVYDETTFHHPVFDAAALEAQKGIAAMQGENRTWYAGAWLRNGFHEDGIASALRVTRRMGVPA